MSRSRFPFLSATWKNLVVVNYEIDPLILHPFVPRGTQLDYFSGKSFVSLVGFLFLKTKLFGGIPTLFFDSFEEVNLRFYIKRETLHETRKAVSFIKEIVPSSTIARMARCLYNEPYVSLPMKHELNYFDSHDPERGGEVFYRWKSNGHWYHLGAKTAGSLKELETGTLPYFILEHYWGYVRQKDGTTKEYRVEHSPWKYWDSAEFEISEQVPYFYGEKFAPFLKVPPHSVFVAYGSPVKLFLGERFSGDV